MKDVDCNNCIHCLTTEAEQNIVAATEHVFVPHRCERYNCRLHHMYKHPALVPCNMCAADDFSEYQDSTDH